ncbi:MAG: histidine phosphatase family protein [Actinomycetia bacterium]|nr:histidine phosphatase family protein [Actinomycetes bacterium]MCP4958092.1 histidine phosphatase family protein [Actinomycetes bacterium]
MGRELLIIRHGQTEWSVAGKHTGLTDLALTDHGRSEAADAARTLGGWYADRCYTSPLVRARETAELVAVDAPLIVDDRLVEWDYGQYEGIRTAEMRAEIPDWSIWTHHDKAGETVDEIGVRLDSFIDEVTDPATAPVSGSGVDVVFAHGHSLAVFIARWLGLDAIEGRRFKLATATVSLLGHHRDDRVLKVLNHRVGDQLPPPY